MGFPGFPVEQPRTFGLQGATALLNAIAVFVNHDLNKIRLEGFVFLSSADRSAAAFALVSSAMAGVTADIRAENAVTNQRAFAETLMNRYS